MPAARKSNKQALQDSGSHVVNMKPYSLEDQFPRTSKKPRITPTEPDFLTEVILPGETAVQPNRLIKCNFRVLFVFSMTVILFALKFVHFLRTGSNKPISSNGLGESVPTAIVAS